MPEPATGATRPPTNTMSFRGRALVSIAARTPTPSSAANLGHDVRLSRPLTGRGAPPICRRHLR
jgi:hypothetical protein